MKRVLKIASVVSENRRLMTIFMIFQQIFTLASGLLCIFVMRRGLEYVPIAIMLVMTAMILLPMRLYRFTGKKSAKFAKTADFALQLVLNNVLIFILPFYIESITFFSRTIFFAPLIIALTVIIGWTNLYNRLITGRPLWGSIYYALVFFCSLNILFPVVFGMRNIYSIAVSGLVAGGLVAVLIIPRMPYLKNRKNMIKTAAGIIFVIAVAWFGRSFIPPAPLMLKDSAACEGIEGFRPAGEFQTAEFPPGKEIYFYSAVFAPSGLQEGIIHRWRYNGRWLMDIDIKEIIGGRKEGFSTWSFRRFLEGTGEYTVEVWTQGGQILGHKSFRVKTQKEDSVMADEQPVE
jgi:hypothetical protein